eukprot:5295068-Amphidinium_carterae.3
MIAPQRFPATIFSPRSREHSSCPSSLLTLPSKSESRTSMQLVGRPSTKHAMRLSYAVKECAADAVRYVKLYGLRLAPPQEQQRKIGGNKQFVVTSFALNDEN